jgi:hypothetical protein
MCIDFGSYRRLQILVELNDDVITYDEEVSTRKG